MVKYQKLGIGMIFSKKIAENQRNLRWKIVEVIPSVFAKSFDFLLTIKLKASDCSRLTIEVSETTVYMIMI